MILDFCKCSYRERGDSVLAKSDPKWTKGEVDFWACDFWQMICDQSEILSCSCFFRSDDFKWINKKVQESKIITRKTVQKNSMYTKKLTKLHATFLCAFYMQKMHKQLYTVIVCTITYKKCTCNLVACKCSMYSNILILCAT